MSKKLKRDDGKYKIRMRQNFANIEMAIWSLPPLSSSFFPIHKPFSYSISSTWTRNAQTHTHTLTWNEARQLKMGFDQSDGGNYNKFSSWVETSTNWRTDLGVRDDKLLISGRFVVLGNYHLVLALFVSLRTSIYISTAIVACFKTHFPTGPSFSLFS